MSTYYVPSGRLLECLSRQQGTGTFMPAPTGGLAWMDSAASDPSIEGLAQPRCAQSPKGFYFPATASMGTYGAETATSVEAQAMVLVGVRACELRARTYLDAVLTGGEFDDADYTARRDATTVVSCDCVTCTDSCFCTLVGGQPYATEGFDVNLTPVDGGFIAEVATDAGKAWLGDGDLSEATADPLAARDRIRSEMTERIRTQNVEYTFSVTDDAPPSLPEGDDERWRTFSADCVECAACTHICPTCHCFYLYDQVLGPETFERVRTWDSCLLSTYHRMAGTPKMKASPRPRLSGRLANRVLHKFVYSPQQYGLLGCVGCGRCIDACLGAIDIRKVVQELSP